MSDYRNQDFNSRNPDDPYRNEGLMSPDARATNATWGWIAAAVFLIVILAVAFGIGHQGGGTNTASNDVTPPAAIQMAPSPKNSQPPTASPAPAPAPANPAPIAPAPNAPAQNNGQ